MEKQRSSMPSTFPFDTGENVIVKVKKDWSWEKSSLRLAKRRTLLLKSPRKVIGKPLLKIWIN